MLDLDIKHSIISLMLNRQALLHFFELWNYTYLIIKSSTEPAL